MDTGINDTARPGMTEDQIAALARAICERFMIEDDVSRLIEDAEMAEFIREFVGREGVTNKTDTKNPVGPA